MNPTLCQLSYAAIGFPSAIVCPELEKNASLLLQQKEKDQIYQKAYIIKGLSQKMGEKRDL